MPRPLCYLGLQSYCDFAPTVPYYEIHGLTADCLFNCRCTWGFPDVPAVKTLPANAGGVRDAALIWGWEDSLEKETATHSSILVRRLPWTEEPGGLQSTGLQRVGQD